jgi:hypothetical protein
MTPPPDPLDQLLDSWSEAPEPPSRLSAEVWHRIARAETGPNWRAAVEAWFARPPFALLFIACCALLGLFLAELRVNRLESERSAQLARSYLLLIDPLLAEKAAPPHT